MEASFEAEILCVKMPSKNIVNVNIVELKKIETLDGQKRDGPLWAVHIKKNKQILINFINSETKSYQWSNVHEKCI